MNALLRGCLIVAILFVALLGFGVTLCGVIVSGAQGGGGLILIGVLMLVGAGVLLVVVVRSRGAATERVLRVAVHRDGRINANGRGVNLATLRHELDSLRKRDGIVWLYREGAEGERHPNAALVAGAIAAAGVPLSLTSHADFSDELRADGTSRPRSPDS